MHKQKAGPIWLVELPGLGVFLAGLRLFLPGVHDVPPREWFPNVLIERTREVPKTNGVDALFHDANLFYSVRPFFDAR